MNANGETMLRRRLRKIVENGFDHRRSEFLGRQAVASADDFRPKRGLVKRVHAIEIQRFAPAARLLGAIENGDRLCGPWKGLAKALRVERSVESHFQHTNSFPEAIQEIGRLASRFTARAHHGNHSLCVLRAVIFKQFIPPACELREAVHGALDDFGAGGIERIHRLASLEKNIGVLRRTAQNRMVRGQRACAMLEDIPLVDHRAKNVFAEKLDFRDLMRGPKAIKEMKKRDTRFERRGVSDHGEILRLLHRSRGEHGPAGCSRSHHVAVVPENRERLRCDRSRRDMENATRQLAGDLVHIRNHQEQTLRCRECRAEGASLQGAMNGSRRAAFALHLNDRRHCPPQVSYALGRPLVSPFPHRRRGCNWIEGDYFVERIGDTGNRFVCVNGLNLRCHQSVLPCVSEYRIRA